MKVVDANVLIAAAVVDHLHHGIANAWLERARREGELLGLTTLVALAFVRITTHPRLHAAPLVPAQAVGWLRALQGSPTVRWLHPAAEHLDALERQLAGVMVGNLVNDAHLAAIAIENGASVVTFDRDFTRFAGLRVELLA
ncbi:MAG: PIN domain-containing protein [Xanthomonadales bacterium]|nr:Ribonuclease VapC37 [Xanthomonadales bacterium]MCC6592806.1 PIN domain-containing protein [Xanthomonadales bacterium]MCE7931691.1 PIN domain-containing protein [Xanthomonadales bacterium PRO6]